MGNDDHECDCFDDIDHFIANVAHFTKECKKKVNAIAMSDEDILKLFVMWNTGGDMEEEPAPPNPFDFLTQLIRDFNQGDSNHPFSFRLYDEDEDGGEGA